MSSSSEGWNLKPGGNWKLELGSFSMRECPKEEEEKMIRGSGRRVKKVR